LRNFNRKFVDIRILDKTMITSRTW